MKAKDEKKELEELLKATEIPDTHLTADTSIDAMPDELKEKPLFTFKYKKQQKKYADKAVNYVMQIVKSIVTEPEILESKTIKDKVQQDSKQLSALYYQEAMIITVEQSNMESIRTGNASPRMYETFTMLSKTHSDIANQISEFEMTLRDNYSKIKFDLMEENTNPVTENNSSGKTLEDKNIYYGTKSLLEDIKNKKIAILEERDSSTNKDDQGNLLPDAG